jgi:hypothetical protein
MNRSRPLHNFDKKCPEMRKMISRKSKYEKENSRSIDCLEA